VAGRTVEFHTVRRTAGLLEVQLEKKDGTPAKGVVVIEGSDEAPHHAASTDAEGRVRFRDLRAIEHRVRGYLSQGGAPRISSAEMSDAELLKCRKTVFMQKARVTVGKTTEVTLREREVGYVRGRIKLPPGGKPSDYAVSSPGRDAAPARVVYDRDTSEFVYGPVAAGEVEIYLQHLAATPRVIYQKCPVTAAAGKVVRTVLDPAAWEKTSKERLSWKWMAVNPNRSS